jgi:polar amino acid transport system substrate-binding protein
MCIKKLLFLLFLLFNFGAQASEKEKIFLYLDWINQFQFAGYYIAKEKGYYDDFNLDVEIKEYSNNTNITKNVISNESTYGVGKSSLIIDKFDGNDIVLLSSIFQSSPLTLITLKSSNIKTPKDLKYKKLMITNDAKETASIKSMIVSQGLNLRDINIQEHSFNLDDLINKKTDAMACYLSNEPYLLKEKNIEFNIINPSDYNFDFYEGILFTSKKELDNNPVRVQSFNNASLRGWKYAFENIEESAKIIYEKYNSQNKSLDALIYEGKVLKKLSRIDENLFGNIDPKTIEEIKRFYSLLGLNHLNSNFETNSILLKKDQILIDNYQIKYLKDNQFTLLAENSNIPFSFKNTDKLAGIEIDFWNLISEKLSKPFNTEEVIKDQIFNIFTNSIKAQFVYSNKQIDDKYILSNSVAKIPIVISTKNNKNYITDLSTLNNITIGVMSNLGILSSLEKDYPNINFIKIQSIDEGLYKLKINKIFGLIDNIYTISNKIVEHQLNELKINTTLNYKIDMFLQVNKEHKDFIDLINIAISTLTEKEKSIILNNYQFILYNKNIDTIYILKFIIPLTLLLALFIFLNYRLKSEIKRREESEIKLSNLANKDSLTNIYNRRKIEEICEEELNRSKRYKNNLSIIFFDINDFKVINDLFGHHIGDEVLTKIAETINKSIRSTDYFGRWGGDEFLIILPQTNLSQVKIIIDSLERNLFSIDFKLNAKQNVTCSFGFAEYKDGDNLDSLLKKADESMYFIKAKYKERKSTFN